MENISDKDLENVSGGKVTTNYFYDSKGKLVKERQVAICDYCGKCDADDKGHCNHVYPINGGHLCENCLKKYKELMK